VRTHVLADRLDPGIDKPRVRPLNGRLQSPPDVVLVLRRAAPVARAADEDAVPRPGRRTPRLPLCELVDEPTRKIDASTGPRNGLGLADRQSPGARFTSRHSSATAS